MPLGNYIRCRKLRRKSSKGVMKSEKSKEIESTKDEKQKNVRKEIKIRAPPRRWHKITRFKRLFLFR